MPKTEHMIDWGKTAAEIGDDYTRVAQENDKLRDLLKRGLQQIEMWQKKYGQWNPEWLPPACDVRWMEDVIEALTPNVQGEEAAPLLAQLPSTAGLGGKGEDDEQHD